MADQHANNVHPVTAKAGWWDSIIGRGKPIDTERYFVICPNVVGACMGTTGPASTNPETGKPWGLDFPVITIRDMVRAQAMLLDHLGIEQLLSVAGGSMGGMQVLQWAASYPQRVFSALPIATSTRHSAQNIAFHEVGRQAVMADPEWRQGRYLIEALPAGTYRVTFTIPGFRTVVRDGIQLSTGFTAPVNAELAVGAVEETVTVSGASSFLRLMRLNVTG